MPKGGEGGKFVRDIGVDAAAILTRRDTNHCPDDTVLVASPVMRNRTMLSDGDGRSLVWCVPAWTLMQHLI